MEHIVYLIAPQCPNDLKRVKNHACKLAKHMKSKNADSVSFSALVTAKWQDDYGDMLCIGDNRKDTLIFYPIKEFAHHLEGFSYLPMKSEQSNSLFDGFETFYSHEMRVGNGNGNENYRVIIMDFRKKSSVFVGNEADVIVRSLEYNFGDRSEINLIYRRENRAAYRRLEELMPENQNRRNGFIGDHGKNNPFSYSAVAALIG